MQEKVHIIKAMIFPIVMYRCESWAIEKAEGQITDAFKLWYCRRLLRVSWTARRSNQSILKEISSEYFIGRNDAEAEAARLWPPDAKSWLIGKDPEVMKGWKQEEKQGTEDEMVIGHHQLNGHGYEQTPGDSEQGCLACCSSWGHKESGTTWWLRNNNKSDLLVSHCVGDKHSFVFSKDSRDYTWFSQPASQGNMQVDAHLEI